MLKESFYLRSEAEASNLVALGAMEIMKSFNIVVRLAVVVLISILVSHPHAEPV